MGSNCLSIFNGTDPIFPIFIEDEAPDWPDLNELARSNFVTNNFKLNLKFTLQYLMTVISDFGSKIMNMPFFILQPLVPLFMSKGPVHLVTT